ncbi:MAG: redoxin domain-containing protein [Planctomycetota bacterium]|jgi:antitoxin component YwqK of YwqJK toxin-antitoxin module/peroxiredoxin
MNPRLPAFLLCVGLLAPACKFLVQQLVDYTETWSSGLPKSRGQLFDGKQSGDWVFYYESGKPRAKGRYDGDRQRGPWTYYYENGVVERAGAFDDQGLRTGEWQLQHPDQTPQARGSYVADCEDGPWQFFAADGALERRGEYDAGQLSGHWEYCQKGGKPRAAGTYHRGQRLGLWRISDEQGNETEQDFGGRPGVAIVREWWPGGALRRVGVAQDGAPTGRWTSWHDNGRLRFCCTLAGNAPAGVFEARDPEGAILAQGRFDAGLIAPGGVGLAGGQSRPLVAGPLPPPSDAAPWAAAAALATLAPEALVAACLAELRAPSDPVAVAAKPPLRTPAAAAPSPAAAAQTVAAIDAEPTRAPAAMQPDLTVSQRREMQDYVAEYTDGPRPGAAGNLLDKYRTSPTAAKPAGAGERKEWYGRQLPFTTMRGVDGKDVDLTQFRGQKRVLLVVLRGFRGEVCTYCIAQTKALEQSRDKLQQLGVEVLVIYPGPRENEKAFEDAYKQVFGAGAPPYRVFYDPDLSLVAQLEIAGDLASPSTLVIGLDGAIEYFYKGEHKADRPATRNLLEKIEGMRK